jgi:hypothetical protein
VQASRLRYAAARSAASRAPSASTCRRPTRGSRSMGLWVGPCGAQRTGTASPRARRRCAATASLTLSVQRAASLLGRVANQCSLRALAAQLPNQWDARDAAGRSPAARRVLVSAAHGRAEGAMLAAQRGDMSRSVQLRNGQRTRLRIPYAAAYSFAACDTAIQPAHGSADGAPSGHYDGWLWIPLPSCFCLHFSMLKHSGSNLTILVLSAGSTTHACEHAQRDTIILQATMQMLPCILCCPVAWQDWHSPHPRGAHGSTCSKAHQGCHERHQWEGQPFRAGGVTVTSPAYASGWCHARALRRALHCPLPQCARVSGAAIRAIEQHPSSPDVPCRHWSPTVGQALLHYRSQLRECVVQVRVGRAFLDIILQRRDPVAPLKGGGRAEKVSP